MLGDDHTESNEETYDIYLLPPGEDPEACQSYLRMRNREGKYNLMFEVYRFIFYSLSYEHISILYSIVEYYIFEVYCWLFMFCSCSELLILVL